MNERQFIALLTGHLSGSVAQANDLGLKAWDGVRRNLHNPPAIVVQMQSFLSQAQQAREDVRSALAAGGGLENPDNWTGDMDRVISGTETFIKQVLGWRTLDPITADQQQRLLGKRPDFSQWALLLRAFGLWIEERQMDLSERQSRLR